MQAAQRAEGGWQQHRLLPLTLECHEGEEGELGQAGERVVRGGCAQRAGLRPARHLVRVLPGQALKGRQAGGAGGQGTAVAQRQVRQAAAKGGKLVALGREGNAAQAQAAQARQRRQLRGAGCAGGAAVSSATGCGCSGRRLFSSQAGSVYGAAQPSPTQPASRAPHQVGQGHADRGVRDNLPPQGQAGEGGRQAHRGVQGQAEGGEAQVLQGGEGLEAHVHSQTALIPLRLSQQNRVQAAQHGGQRCQGVVVQLQPPANVLVQD